VRNGLTAVTAESLTQRAVVNGFYARQCYGTSGARILLDVTIDGHPMGSEIAIAGSPRIDIQAEGTSGIERIDLFRGTELIASREIAEPDENRYRLLVGGAKEIGTAAAQRQIWTGSLTVEGGSFSDAEPVGFQSPLDQLTITDQEVAYNTATAGNDLGFTFKIDGSDDAILNLDAPQASVSVTCPQLKADPKRLDCGGLNRRIELSAAPASTCPQSVSISFTDPDPLSGENAYWIRLTQTDRHRAWSSPIYVTVR